MSEPPYYDVTGQGPVLLVVPGGAGHPMGFGPVTERLAERFTVVTYDPLGLAHGRLGPPVPEQRVADWSEGARQVLEAVLPADGAAYVFGTSSGGIAALDLAVRHPERLAHVVAHEPPCVTLLPDGERERQTLVDSLDGGRQRPYEGDSATPIGVFVARVLRPFTAYVPPARPASPHLTVAAGADSAGQVLHRTAKALAGRLGAGFTEFPGGHLGVLEHPEDFADHLTTTLLEDRPS
ncbi:alpha/beta fold hydrolase [Streptomyces sp. NPDC026672]|uniref:alpha/beta fold hydrolase n=1 Tax=unclassified Streptomyces TaxID=2593676 RepID=UPI0033CFB8D1